MAGPIEDVALALAAAVKTVRGVQPITRTGTSPTPPAVVVGPPVLEWDAQCREPSSAQFPVFVVVALDERSMDRLWDLVPRVSAAIDELPDATVTRATPTVYNGAGTDLPAYLLTVEVAL